MLRPLIGITTRRISTRGLGPLPPGVADAGLEGGFTDYSNAVAGAGGLPVLLPMSADPVDAVARLDGLVLTGGEDVEPRRYGADFGPYATGSDPIRDEFEFALVGEAVGNGTPVLAICRGLQVLNVACGGTLVDHLEPAGGLDHAATEAHRSERRHRIRVEPHSMIGGILTDELDATGHTDVNSFHHQAVATPGSGLRVVARADDGTVEAVEDASRGLLGVQWHPEMYAGVDPVFVWLMKQSRRGRSSLTARA